MISLLSIAQFERSLLIWCDVIGLLGERVSCTNCCSCWGDGEEGGGDSSYEDFYNGERSNGKRLLTRETIEDERKAKEAKEKD